MKHFSSTCKTSIIGVDRTFNLGACLVTTTQCIPRIKTETKGCLKHQPNHIGTCIPSLGWCFSYQRFFTHLASVLNTKISDTLLSFNDLVIGSDEEKF